MRFLLSFVFFIFCMFQEDFRTDLGSFFFKSLDDAADNYNIASSGEQDLKIDKAEFFRYTGLQYYEDENAYLGASHAMEDAKEDEQIPTILEEEAEEANDYYVPLPEDDPENEHTLYEKIYKDDGSTMYTDEDYYYAGMSDAYKRRRMSWVKKPTVGNFDASRFTIAIGVLLFLFMADVFAIYHYDYEASSRVTSDEHWAAVHERMESRHNPRASSWIRDVYKGRPSRGAAVKNGFRGSLRQARAAGGTSAKSRWKRAGLVVNAQQKVIAAVMEKASMTAETDGPVGAALDIVDEMRTSELERLLKKKAAGPSREERRAMSMGDGQNATRGKGDYVGRANVHEMTYDELVTLISEPEEVQSQRHFYKMSLTQLLCCAGDEEEEIEDSTHIRMSIGGSIFRQRVNPWASARRVCGNLRIADRLEVATNPLLYDQNPAKDDDPELLKRKKEFQQRLQKRRVLREQTVLRQRETVAQLFEFYKNNEKGSVTVTPGFQDWVDKMGPYRYSVLLPGAKVLPLFRSAFRTSLGKSGEPGMWGFHLEKFFDDCQPKYKAVRDYTATHAQESVQMYYGGGQRTFKPASEVKAEIKNPKQASAEIEYTAGGRPKLRRDDMGAADPFANTQGGPSASRSPNSPTIPDAQPEMEPGMEAKVLDRVTATQSTPVLADLDKDKTKQIMSVKEEEQFTNLMKHMPRLVRKLCLRESFDLQNETYTYDYLDLQPGWLQRRKYQLSGPGADEKMGGTKQGAKDFMKALNDRSGLGFNKMARDYMNTYSSLADSIREYHIKFAAMARADEAEKSAQVCYFWDHSDPKCIAQQCKLMLNQNPQSYSTIPSFVCCNSGRKNIYVDEEHMVSRDLFYFLTVTGKSEKQKEKEEKKKLIFVSKRSRTHGFSVTERKKYAQVFDQTDGLYYEESGCLTVLTDGDYCACFLALIFVIGVITTFTFTSLGVVKSEIP